MSAPRTEKLKVGEVRDAAYGVMALFITGSPEKEKVTDTMLDNAIEIVLSDERKSRTKRERYIQMMVAMAIGVGPVLRFARGMRDAKEKALRA